MNGAIAATPGRVDRRDQRQRKRRPGDQRDIGKTKFRGDASDVIDIGIEHLEAEQLLQHRRDVACVEREQDPETDTGQRADPSDDRALHDERTDDAGT